MRTNTSAGSTATKDTYCFNRSSPVKYAPVCWGRVALTQALSEAACDVLNPSEPLPAALRQRKQRGEQRQTHPAVPYTPHTAHFTFIHPHDEILLLMCHPVSVPHHISVDCLHRDQLIPPSGSRPAEPLKRFKIRDANLKKSWRFV